MSRHLFLLVKLCSHFCNLHVSLNLFTPGHYESLHLSTSLSIFVLGCSFRRSWSDLVAKYRTRNPHSGCGSPSGFIRSCLTFCFLMRSIRYPNQRTIWDGYDMIISQTALNIFCSIRYASFLVTEPISRIRIQFFMKKNAGFRSSFLWKFWIRIHFLMKMLDSDPIFYENAGSVSYFFFNDGHGSNFLWKC